jgi:prepilin-type N-terminal cleavage/methylation domain-containing protein
MISHLSQNNLANLMQRNQGYTLIELLVALSVAAIVIAGTYAGYTFFARQHQLLQFQTELDRTALKAIDLLASDIRMAGYKDYQNANVMSVNQPMQIVSSAPGDLILVFDDYDQSGVIYRALIHYFVQAYSPAGGLARSRLVREWKKCNNPSTFCDLSNSSFTNGTAGPEPVLDWIVAFSVQGLHQRSSGSFLSQYQSVQIDLTLSNQRSIEGINKSVSKNYQFIARARNVSLVP